MDVDADSIRPEIEALTLHVEGLVDHNRVLQDAVRRLRKHVAEARSRCRLARLTLEALKVAPVVRMAEYAKRREEYRENAAFRSKVLVELAEHEAELSKNEKEIQTVEKTILSYQKRVVPAPIETRKPSNVLEFKRVRRPSSNPPSN